MLETMVIRFEWWTNYGAIIVTARDAMSNKSVALSRDEKVSSLESVIAEAMKIITKEVLGCQKESPKQEKK